MKSSYDKMSLQLLITMLPNSNTLEKCDIIRNIASRKNSNSSSVKKALMEETKDQRSFWNDYLVSDFAYAALDILGLEEYKGNKEETNRLIQSKLCFD